MFDKALFRILITGVAITLLCGISEAAETPSNNADISDCPPVAFLVRHPHSRKGTNGTMLGQRPKRPGSAIRVYDPEKGAKTIFETKKGFIFDMSVSYDGAKLLFSYMEDITDKAKTDDAFHIWEINAEGSGLRQLTSGTFHDGSPIYLPDGRIVFASTRVESFSLCQDYLAAALYIMDGDGGNLRRLEYNTLCDTTPWVMQDGSILFSRWEYQDKNIFSVQGLWTINPDGTRVQLYYGNTVTVPNSIYNAKQIPGTQKVITVMAAHHHLPIGGIAIIDRSQGLESAAAMTSLTPEVPYKPTVGETWDHKENRSWGPGDVFHAWTYTDPYPISENHFLVSYGGAYEDIEKRYRLYLMDASGAKTLLHEEPELSCFNPVPLMQRPRPHHIPGEVPEQPTGEGTFFVQDVYQGLLEAGVQRGDVKALRVMSQLPKKYNTEGMRYQDHYPVMGVTTYYAKICFGTVPVYEDGSAYFNVPAGVELYFQALDASGKEIRRMGTITQITDGEIQSCVGCHESRFQTPHSGAKTLANLNGREPDSITPPLWGAGPVDFVAQVQPVLDKYCAGCHQGQTPPHGIDLSGDKTRMFNMAYSTLTDRRLVDYYYINHGPTGNFPPLQSGSRMSKIVEKIEKNHENVNMDDESRRRIYTWIDSNALYYGTNDISRPHTLGGRDTWFFVKDNQRVTAEPEPWFKDFHDVWQNNCQKCHGEFINMDMTQWSGRNVHDSWINLTRPKFSKVLNTHLNKEFGGKGFQRVKDGMDSPYFETTDDPIYQGMLQAITRGKAALEARPRMDMPDGVAIPQQRDFGKLY